MSDPERDPYTGRMTTGHEWNGIKELMTPVPRIVWLCLNLTIIFSIIMWVLYPTWPLGAHYTKGVLGVDQRQTVKQALVHSAEMRAAWEAKLVDSEFSSLASDPEIMPLVRQHGARLFADNCAGCHGADAKGGDGYPSLVDGQWLWGGDPDTIMETLRVGINSGHPEARIAQMMAFGELGVLDADARRAVNAYVRSLSPGDDKFPLNADDVTAGREVFAVQCAACHGEDGTGFQALGAPNLTDEHWIYGGEATDIARTLRSGRAGVMPYWGERLSLSDRKMLTLYILDLGEAAQ